MVLDLPAPVSQLLSKQQTAHAAAAGVAAEHAAAAKTTDVTHPFSDAAGPPMRGIKMPLGCNPQQEQQQEQQQQQGQQHQQLVLVPESVLVQLLQRCNDAAVRQLAHEAGLQPKLRRAAALLDQLARWVAWLGV